MRRQSHWLCLIPLALALAISGCGLNVDRTLDIQAGGRNTITVEPARSQKTLKVDVSSPDVAVDVYVVLDKDLNALQKALDSNKTPPSLLASKLDTKSVVLEATIPADSAAVVLVAPSFGKAAKVRVKLTN